jgi:hyaluronoglucosaminidase
MPRGHDHPRRPQDRSLMRRRLGRSGLLALTTLGVLLLASCTSSPEEAAVGARTTAGHELWVANYSYISRPGNTVTPVNLITHRADTPVHTASQPAGLALARGGRLLLVTNKGSDTLSEVNTATRKVVHTTLVGLQPVAVAVDAKGDHGQGLALVANYGGNSVTPVNIATGKAGTPIPAGQQPIAVTAAHLPNGRSLALVADFGGDGVTPIDLGTMEPSAPLVTGPGPVAIGVGDGGLSGQGLALVGNFSNSTLTPIDLGTLDVGRPISIPANPTGIAVTTDGVTAYVCGGASLIPVAMSTLALGPVVTLPDVAQAVVIAKGSVPTAWVALQQGRVIPVTLGTGAVGHPVKVGGRPSAVAVG